MLKLTKSGTDLLLRAIAGETNINFSAIQLGNGADAGESATGLTNPLLTVEVSSYEVGDVFVTLSSVFSNAEVAAGFRATELGVLADDPDREGHTLLYAYGYTPDAQADYIPAGTDRLLETQQDIMVYIGDAENVTASISQSLVYASKDDVDALRKELQEIDLSPGGVGLGNVPNVATNDQTPTYKEADTMAKIKSGEKLSVAFGKIARAISSIIEHVAAKGNVHDAKPEDIGAAQAEHKHSTNDLTSGTLGVARGGTGTGEWEANKLIYAGKTDALSQMGFPADDRAVLRQNKSGAPYWSSPQGLKNDMGLNISAATAALFGLGENAVPDEALACVGKYNQHWWRRRTAPYYVPVVGEYGDKPLSWQHRNNRLTTVQYSDSITIDDVGLVSLVSPITINVSYDNYTLANVIKGKYFRYKLLVDEGTTTAQSGPDYSDVHLSAVSNAVTEAPPAYDDDPNFYIVYMRGAPVTAQYIAPGDWEHLQSLDRNAYPDAGVSDGYEYDYRGIPFESAASAPKIAFGSYVGTGEYGSDHPNRLTFDFAPRLLVICATEDPVYNSGFVVCHAGGRTGTGGVAASVDGHTVSWYDAVGKTAQAQLNTADTLYYYVAIG